MPGTVIRRDGFESTQGRFYVVDVGDSLRCFVERIETQHLKAMFLPRLTPEANKMFRDHLEFVRCQLKHYGVEYDEKDFTGQGAVLMKKALLAGKVSFCPVTTGALQC